jgi:hypothetical protein
VQGEEVMMCANPMHEPREADGKASTHGKMLPLCEQCLQIVIGLARTQGDVTVIETYDPGVLEERRS